MPPRRPTSSIESNFNKPLPPSPLASGQGSGRPSSSRGFQRREPPVQLGTMHLRPEPYPHQYSTSNTGSTEYYHHSYSRSMPSSPRGFHQSSLPHHHTFSDRAQSAASNYPESGSYTMYPETQNQAMYFHEQDSNFTSDYFDTPVTWRPRTYPPLSDGTPSTRDNVPSRVRPHSSLSPTEPFTAISQFAEAITGLPDDTYSPSPNTSPQLQGSLFARRSRNDTIPIPLQYPQETQSTRSHRSDWQNFEPPRTIPSPLVSGPSSPTFQHRQPPPQMQAFNVELAMLGLEDEHGSDDELPDYAQSQAEMNAKKRAEASARARELEARWRNTRRGW
ncbi:hypothetical protein J1614_000188 [Plenodomus biglobosus]|nr:hypothetical protein J1614_000188 [Plenodomus biglobosus]